MGTELICPTCHVGLDEQQLLTQTWRVEACPNCRSVVRRTEAFEWSNRDALNTEDISTINEWVAAIQREIGSGMRIAVRREKNRVRWEIADLPELHKDSSQWTSSIEYDPMVPRVLDLRLTSKQEIGAFVEDLSILSTACAEQGVQAHGSQHQEWTAWQGQSYELNWGAEQLLRINQHLTVTLFQAVIERLHGAMRNALDRISECQSAIEVEGSGNVKVEGVGLSAEAVKCFKA
jgi:hypothetical protein